MIREPFIIHLSKGGNCKKDTEGLTATMVPAVSAYADGTEAPD